LKSPETDPPVAVKGSLRGPALKFGILVVLLAGTFAAARWSPLGQYLQLDRLKVVLEELRGAWWSPIVHLSIFIVLGAVGVPATPIILVGAAIFGALWGTVWNWAGIVLASAAGYLVAKALGREFIEKIGGDKLRRAEKVLHRRGFLPLVAVRFIPVPFALVNAAAAVVGVRFAKFFFATMLGMALPIGIFTYFAAAILEAATGDRAALVQRLAVVSISIAFLVFLPLGIRRRLRKRRLRLLQRERAERGPDAPPAAS